MNTRILVRWMVSMVIAIGAIGAIGLVLNPAAQARATVTHEWPGGLLPACNTPSLQQCIDSPLVLPGDVIHIKPGVYTQSVTLDKPVSLISDGPAVTILYAQPGQRVLTVTGIITSNTLISGLTFRGGVVTSDACPDGCGGGVSISGAARPTLQNIALVQNTAWRGGGLWVDGGPPVNLSGVAFISNTALTAGGGLFALPDTQLFNSDFEGNTSNENGGGAYVAANVVLSAGQFIGNRTTGLGSGGGVYAGSLRANGTQFFGNTANGSSTAYGGGAYIAAGVADLNLVRFEDNFAGGAGGGLYVGGPVTLTNSTLVNNSAEMAFGGGLYAGGDLFIKDSRLENNVSRFGSGGGAYAQNPAKVVDSVFVSNSASFQGGGLAGIEGADVQRSQFLHNASSQSGGGLDIEGSLAITGSVFISNSALIGSGVYHNASGDGRVVNSLFARNVGTESNMGVLQLASTGHVDVIHTTIADPSGMPVNPAAAIRLESGSLNIVDTIIADHAIGIYNNGVGAAYEDYNLFSNVSTFTVSLVTSGGHDQNPATPQFVDVTKDDYHLRFTSDAIDSGTGAGVYFDIDGQPRPIGLGFDIGFDESGRSIQQMIDGTPPGGAVFIPSGAYVESLTLYKPVSLHGAGSSDTIINAVAGERVLTVTGPITPSTQIAALTLRGGNVMGGGFERAGGGVLITATARPSFINVNIVNNSADFGGGLYVHDGGATLNNSLVAGNNATQSGGGAYVTLAGAVLEQNGGSFENNTAKDGAGVFVQSGLFQQNGGSVSNNIATNWGGGLIIGNGGTIRTVAGQIISNSAQNAGGGVFVDLGRAELINSDIVGNNSSAGGGVYVRDLSGASGMLFGGKVVQNTASGYGGGVYAGSALTITGTRFFGNTAYDGSAVEITGTAQARIANAFIAQNPAIGAFPSTNASLRFDSSSSSYVLNTTVGNATQPLTRAVSINNGSVTIVNTIIATYTNGLSWFGGTMYEDYNLFFHTGITTSGSINHGGHSLFGLDPLFKNPGADDYHIKGLSPAVNKGMNAGVRRDIDLDARPLGGGFDIGADEASVASTNVNPTLGGAFIYTTSQNSTINVNVPPGAVTGTLPIYCSLIDPSTVSLPRRFKLAGVIFELDADIDPVNVVPGTINFLTPVTLTVSYTDEELASAGITNELDLKLYRFEPIGWQPIGYRPGETQTLDVDNNLITAALLGFSRIGKFGATQGVDVYLPLIFR